MPYAVEIRFGRDAIDNPKYPKTLDEFVKAEEVEYDDPDPFGQHTHWVMDHATHTIDASQPLEIVQLELSGIMEELGVTPTTAA